jgi:hypothetical protein
MSLGNRNLVDVFEAWENQSTIASERDIRHVWSNETWTRSIGRQPRVPWYAKALAFSVAGYEFSPIDLIPDFVPILGRWTMLSLCVGHSDRGQIDSAGEHGGKPGVSSCGEDRPVGYIAAIVIAIVWASCIVLAGWFCYRSFVG